MNQDCFDNQIKRLKLRFGDKAFDPEFVKLVGAEVYSLSNQQFVGLCDVMIGHRKHSDPPRLTDFREMRLQCEKDQLARNTHLAFEAASRDRPDIKEVFKNTGFEGCKSAIEALEVQMIKNRIAKADKDDGGAA